MIWFTSDTHFGHEKILGFDPRPFSSIEEHDQVIIDNWNKVVKNGDIVYHLGDFNYRSKEKTDYYLNRLNGSIHIIWGNHDDDGAWKFRERFGSHHDILYTKINNQKITLCHYPIVKGCWRAASHGAWMLHGHCHGFIKSEGKRLDVGVLTNGFTPVSYDWIEAFMKNKENTEHHPPKDPHD